ncbi:peptidoglycan recognition family protein [Dermacoccaceae bacterium W4C1]
MENHTVSRRSVLLGASAGAALGAFGLGTVATPAQAAGIARPKIYSTKDWGAKSAKGSISTGKNPSYIIVHHTAGPNSSDTSLAYGKERARAIQAAHFANGWTDTGQHFTIDRGGHILEGRHGTIAGLDSGSSFPIGAHTRGHGMNTKSLGIEVDGNFMTVLPRDEQFEQVIDLCSYLCRRYGIKVGRIRSHREYDATDCPGDRFFERFGALRWHVQKRLDEAA